MNKPRTLKTRPRKRHLLAAIIIFIAMYLLVFQTPALDKANIYYIDATLGNDDWSGIIEEGNFKPLGCETDGDTSDCVDGPWKTIGKVNYSSFNPGDAILFKRGETWKEQLIISSSGRHNKAITYSDYGDGERPVIDAEDSRLHGIDTNIQSNIVINGFQIRNTVLHGLYIHADNFLDSLKISIEDTLVDGTGVGAIYPAHGILAYGSDITINNCEVKNTSNEGIYARGHNLEVANSYIHNNNGGDNIHINLDSDNYHIHHNTLINNLSSKGCFVATDFDDPYETPSNGIFEYNTCTSSAQFGVSDIGSGATVRYNIIESPNGPAINAGSANGAYYYNIIKNSKTAFYVRGNSTDTAKNIKIYNNTIYNVNRGIDSNITNSLTTSIEAKNNIFYLEPFGDAYKISSNTTINSDYNIFYPESSGFIYYQGSPFHRLEDFINATGQDSSSLALDPLFVDQENNDFHLTMSSPARNAGIKLKRTADYDGTTVPQEKITDIGAFEHIQN